MSNVSEFYDVNNAKISTSSRFNKLSITEELQSDNTYKYFCRYDVDIKFTDVNTSNKLFNNMINKNFLHGSGTLQREHNERPDVLTKKDNDGYTIVPQEDIDLANEDPEAGEDFINDDIEYYIKNKADTMNKLQLVVDIFGHDIPRELLTDAIYNDEYDISNVDNKVKSVTYDVRKPKVDRVVVEYEDGSYHNILVPEVTNKQVDAVFPGMSLLTLYDEVDNMIAEDYSSTVALLSELFGFNLETLKGAKLDD